MKMKKSFHYNGNFLLKEIIHLIGETWLSGQPYANTGESKK